MCYLTRTKRHYTSVECICNWNTSVIGKKQRMVGFLTRKPLPRSTTNSTV